MKLLNKSLVGFAIYAVVAVLLLTPIFYIVINNLIIDSVDKTLQVHKREIVSRLEALPSETEVQQWEDLDGEVIVAPSDRKRSADSIYTLEVSGSDALQPEVYRVLQSSVTIKGKPYHLQARVSIVESEDLIRTLAWAQLALLIALLSGVLVIHWWNSRSTWKPFYTTLEKLKAFRLEKNNPLTLTPSKIKEFNDLNAAIIDLTRRDQAAFIVQKEFTENAAHEMQTPLAIFQSKIELLLQTQPSETQAPLLESLLDATSRLNQLNRALLLLARIDNRQFHDQEQTEIAALVSTVCARYNGERISKEMNFDVDIINSFEVIMNGPLLDILVSNLISNAIRHGARGAAIKIAIDKNTLTIMNPGTPLPFPPDKLFQRFTKGVNQRDGLGLGLAIVRKITDTAGLDLQYRFAEGHIFTLEFPKSKVATKSQATFAS